MFDIILLHALYGWSLPISKKLLCYASPCFLAGSRLFLGGVILLMYIWFKGDKSKRLFNKKHLLLYIQVATIGVYLKYILRYWALSYMSSAKMALIMSVSPFFAALFSYLWFNEKLSRVQWIGIAIVSVSSLPIILSKTGADISLFSSWFISLPTLALLGAIAAHFHGMVIARKLIRELHYSAAETNGIRMFGGGLLALLTAFAFEGYFPVNNPLSFGAWFLLLLLLSNIICHNMYMSLLKRYSITFLSLTDYLIQFFTAFYGWTFLHETITWHYAASGLIVIIGLYIFYQDELRTIHATQSESKAHA